MRTITISPVLNGYLCHVGCQTVAFTSPKELLKELGRYLKDPLQVEKEYRLKAVNKISELEPACAPSPMGLAEPVAATNIRAQRR